MSASRFIRFLACLSGILLFLSGTALGEKSILLTFTGDTMLRMEEILNSNDNVTRIKELFDQVKGYISDLNGIGL